MGNGLHITPLIGENFEQWENSVCSHRKVGLPQYANFTGRNVAVCRCMRRYVKHLYLFIYLGFYVAFNTVQVISRWAVGRVV